MLMHFGGLLDPTGLLQGSLVRTFVPPVVGMSTMPYRRFLLWNAIGGALWALLLALAGYFLGQIPVIADNVDLIAIAIVVLSVIPIAITIIRERRANRTSAVQEHTR